MRIERVAHWVEIAANLGVIVTLLLVAAEVRSNTAVLQRQARMDRAEAMNNPFLNNPALAETLARIKEVDGWEVPGFETTAYEVTFSERYGLPIESGIVWGRHLAMVWANLEADFALDGPSPELAQRIRLLLLFPDNQIAWQTEAGPYFSREFTDYVRSLRGADAD